MSYRSWVLHMSMPVATMQPARPRRDRRKPTTWHVVVDMASARGPAIAGSGAALAPVRAVGGRAALLGPAALIRRFPSARGVCSRCFP